MRKYYTSSIIFTGIIFGIYAVLTWYHWYMHTFRDQNPNNLGLFPLANALTFGCLFFFSLHRIIKIMQSRLEEYEQRIKKLESHLAVTKET